MNVECQTYYDSYRAWLAELGLSCLQGQGTLEGGELALEARAAHVFLQQIKTRFESCDLLPDWYSQEPLQLSDLPPTVSGEEQALWPEPAI